MYTNQLVQKRYSNTSKQIIKEMLNLIPKWSTNPFINNKKWFAKNIENYHPKYANISDFGFHFGASCMADSRGGAFFSRPVFRNLWGVPPWTDVGLPWGTLAPILSSFWKMLLANLLQTSKIPGQQMAPTTPSRKQVGIQTNTDNLSTQILFYFCYLTKPRKSEAPDLKQIGSAELPNG